MADENAKRVGRPTLYTPALARKICDVIATTEKGIKRMCEEHPEFPTYDTIFSWIIKYKEFSEWYDKAKRLQQAVIVEEMLAIAYDESRDYIATDKGAVGNPTAVSRDRLKIDTLKWHAARLAPTKYGDRTHNEITVVSHEQALLEIMKDD